MMGKLKSWGRGGVWGGGDRGGGSCANNSEILGGGNKG